VRTVWLLRHAKSSWDDPTLPDADRPLAPRGRRAAAAIAAHIASADVRPELVLCSSGLRARETLAAVLPSLGAPVEVRIEPDLYTFDDEVVRERLRRTPAGVRAMMVVGHNPALQQLALALARSGPARARLLEKFPTGALATIRLPDGAWTSVGDGAGEIAALVVPRDLTA